MNDCYQLPFEENSAMQYALMRNALYRNGKVIEIYQKGYRVYVGLVRNAILFADDNDVVEEWDFSNYQMKVLIK